MRVRTNKLFPYPVLSEANDSYKDNTFSCETAFSYDSVTAFLSFQYSINDKVILELLKTNAVGLYFEIECSETKYRELFRVSLDDNLSFKIDMPLERLNGTLELVSLLICNEDINDYSNDNLNEFYNGEKINLHKYAIIGFTDSVSYYVNKKIDSNGDVPSIFSISFDDQGTQMTFEPNGDVVTIFLPKNEYEIYNEYKGKSKRLKQLMINFPVLINLLDLIKDHEHNDFSGKPWYNALEIALSSKEGYSDGFGSNKFQSEPSTVTAQNLLGNLIQDAFDDFDKIQEE